MLFNISLRLLNFELCPKKLLLQPNHILNESNNIPISVVVKCIC